MRNSDADQSHPGMQIKSNTKQKLTAHFFYIYVFWEIKCSSSGLGLMIVLFSCGFKSSFDSKYEFYIEFQIMFWQFQAFIRFGDILFQTSTPDTGVWSARLMHPQWPGLQRVCLRTFQRTQKRQGTKRISRWEKYYETDFVLFLLFLLSSRIWISPDTPQAASVRQHWICGI